MHTRYRINESPPAAARSVQWLILPGRHRKTDRAGVEYQKNDRHTHAHAFLLAQLIMTDVAVALGPPDVGF